MNYGKPYEASLNLYGKNSHHRYISDIMCDDSRLRRVDSSGLKRVDSLQSLDDSFEEVPEAKDFKFQINVSHVLEFAYTLKKGKSLPYSLTLEGTLLK